ncbi:hypothetical protein LEP1GSC043_1276 [Leptospira weilii str. Ecochallenge]|uniref:Uncharacterized protein n=1 Tax=Leptospira weilii str. Ecochallenge TaxID=1049986 RepID=N1U6S1_9LEPT|nr:hypothetical protein LEP1GSC043_1276 [Leptospira weilii str. Ecochallenge]
MNTNTREQLQKHSEIMRQYRANDPFGDPNHGTPDWMDDVMELIYSREEFLVDSESDFEVE